MHSAVFVNEKTEFLVKRYRRWSKLQKELYVIRATGLNFQIHCNAYRMKSQRGSTDLPRYWITLGKEIIWDYPKDFDIPTRSRPNQTDEYYPYYNDTPSISCLIREYIDTPRNELLSKDFTNDEWDLIEILRAMDRRIGLKKLVILKDTISNAAAIRVIDERLVAGKNSGPINK